VDWSPDGATIAFVDNTARLFLVDAGGGLVPRQVGTNGPVLSIAYSPSGDEIAFVGGRGDLKTVDLATGVTRTVVSDTPSTRAWSNPTWSPDGQMLAFFASEDNMSSISLVQADGSGRRVVVSVEGQDPEWSPDGGWIAFQRDDDLFMVAVDGSIVRPLTDQNVGGWGADWSATLMRDLAGADPMDVPTPEEIVNGRSLTGQALADALGLTLEPKFTGSCRYFTEMNDGGEGYCLDDLTRSDVHAYMIAEALRGREVTEHQLLIVRLTLEPNRWLLDVEPMPTEIRGDDAALDTELSRRTAAWASEIHLSDLSDEEARSVSIHLWEGLRDVDPDNPLYADIPPGDLVLVERELKGRIAALCGSMAPDMARPFCG
jgi:hypothetical protein